MPDLYKILTTKTIEKNKVQTRYFHNDYYEKFSWLCASEKRNKMVCLPCILYSSENNCWTNNGYNDLNNFHKARNRHEKSHSHLKACILLKIFVKENIDKTITNDNKHLEKNSIVTRNREIMKV